MKSKISSIIAIFMIFLMVVTMVAGCSSAKDVSGGEEDSGPSSSDNSESSSADTSEKTLEKITLTAMGVHDAVLDPLTGGDPNKRPVAIELEKRTGVHIEYIMTTSEDYDTKLNLLIASGQAPDLFGLPSNYPGGYSRAAEDGVIIKINEYWDKYAPNYKKVIESNPEWAKSAKADNGDVYFFACIREDKSIGVFFGPMLRKDLLDAAGLPLPETIDDWYITLKAFKEAGVKNPFTSLNWFIGYSGAFVGAYGAHCKMVVGEDGKAQYGPIQPGYKEFLRTFNQWYKEGLIDPDYVALQDWGVLDTKMQSGESAACLHFLSKIGTYTEAGKKINPDFQMVATKYPVLKKGEQPLYGQIEQPLRPLIAISAKCKYIERALQYLDYGYTPEGQLLLNFGIEGESYTLDASGNPVYTELITAVPTNSKGWTQEQALKMYCPASGDACTVQMKAYFEQIRLNRPEQKNAVSLWAESRIPSSMPNISFTDAELEITKKLTDIDSYVQEMTAKFILGEESLDNFDKFVEHCKDLGIEEIIDVYNKALTRYNNRK